MHSTVRIYTVNGPFKHTTMFPFTYQRLISAVAPSFLLALTLTLSLSRSPSGSNAKQTLKPEGDRDFPVLEEYAQSDEEYSKAIENRSVIIQEFDLENEYVY